MVEGFLREVDASWRYRACTKEGLMSNGTKVTSIDDWLVLVDRKLTTVVDPMVFRAGEVFLRGRSGKGVGDARPRAVNEAESWSFLDKNMLALGFFFDALILNERLPLFDYASTYDSHLSFEERVFAAFNDSGQSVIEPVHVDFKEYTQIKELALQRLRDGLEERSRGGAGPWLSQQEAKAILDELSATEHKWNIAVGPELEQLLPAEDDRRLAGFLLGGMIFGEYAARMQSEHWMQPKRAGLFVKATAGSQSPTRNDEQQLFEWLAAKYGLPALRSWQPTFFHLVLERARSLSDVPKVIHDLRRSSAVADYRAWRTEALYEWRTKGGLSKQALRTAERLKQALYGAGGSAATEASVALIETVASQTPASAAKAVGKIAPLFGWVLDAVPGRRHIKLLATSLHAREHYPRIEQGVRTLWQTH
jgi:hypothetical protein